MIDSVMRTPAARVPAPADPLSRGVIDSGFHLRDYLHLNCFRISSCEATQETLAAEAQEVIRHVTGKQIYTRRILGPQCTMLGKSNTAPPLPTRIQDRRIGSTQITGSAHIPNNLVNEFARTIFAIQCYMLYNSLSEECLRSKRATPLGPAAACECARSLGTTLVGCRKDVTASQCVYDELFTLTDSNTGPRV